MSTDQDGNLSHFTADTISELRNSNAVNFPELEKLGTNYARALKGLSFFLPHSALSALTACAT